MFPSGRPSFASITRTLTAGALALVLVGCTGTDPQADDQFPFPSLSNQPASTWPTSDQPSGASQNPGAGLGAVNPAQVPESVVSESVVPESVVPESVARVQSELTALLANSQLAPEDMAAFAQLADEVVSGAIARINMTPEEFAQLTPEQVAAMVDNAAKQSRHAVEVNLEQLRQMTPEQRALIAQSAAVVSQGLLNRVADDATAALGNRQGSLRIGVNELGGYAASAAYLWVYLLDLAGYAAVVEVASGAELAHMVNTDQLDVAFEAVPDFLEPDTAALGVWSDGRLNVQGRAGLHTTYPELASSLERFALNPQQMRSLAAVVKTRGVADPQTQQAAVQLWLVNHPELVQRLANR